MTINNTFQFTGEQGAIIAHPPGQSARILAGPGTGKSFTAVAYLERLTQTYPELRSRMLTFTRAATDEFAQKMGDAGLAGLGVTSPATVHSFALSLLVRLGKPRTSFTLHSHAASELWAMARRRQPSFLGLSKRWLLAGKRLTRSNLS